jgi:GNAT superfamily N-acetyltransferase
MMKLHSFNDLSAPDTRSKQPLNVFRWDVPAPLVNAPHPGQWLKSACLWDLMHLIPLGSRSWGVQETGKACLRVLSGRRIFFGTVIQGRLIQSAWASIGFCRYYPVERYAVVLGTLWTDPPYRGRGIATSCLRHAINQLLQLGYRRFYIDAESNNHASLRMIEKTGFRDRVITPAQTINPLNRLETAVR